MLRRVLIHSRAGNLFLTAIGALFALASSTLLAYYVVSTWDASSLIDIALQVMLLVGVAAGLVFIGIGRGNLRQRTG
jgi:hypothetical protein